jgi:hypothetical protein
MRALPVERWREIRGASPRAEERRQVWRWMWTKGERFFIGLMGLYTIEGLERERSHHENHGRMRVDDR